MSKNKYAAKREFYKSIQDLVEHPVVLEMKKYPQHGKTNCYKHCLRVAYCNYCLCKMFHLDARSAARAGMIHDCQHSGLKTKEWLANHGISKDTYYYWYKKVQTVCVEAMEMPDTLSMPEFMLLPVPAEPANVPVESAIRSNAIVTMHIGKAGIEAEWDKLLD